MKALYEIDQEILECVDMESGEILDSDRLTALQMERDQKLEGVALWVKDLNYEAQMVKEEADKLTARKKALDNKIASLKAWLLWALDGEKLKTPRCNVYQTHSQRVAFDSEEEFIKRVQGTEDEALFLRYKEPEINKQEVKAALKDGMYVPFAHLETTESVVIK